MNENDTQDVEPEVEVEKPSKKFVVLKLNEKENKYDRKGVLESERLYSLSADQVGRSYGAGEYLIFEENQLNKIGFISGYRMKVKSEAWFSEDYGDDD